jgi:hypothetical protein
MSVEDNKAVVARSFDDFRGSGFGATAAEVGLDHGVAALPQLGLVPDRQGRWSR